MGPCEVCAAVREVMNKPVPPWAECGLYLVMAGTFSGLFLYLLWIGFDVLRGRR